MAGSGGLRVVAVIRAVNLVLAMALVAAVVSCVAGCVLTVDVEAGPPDAQESGCKHAQVQDESVSLPSVHR